MRIAAKEAKMLRNNIVCIAGAASGFGRELARAFAAQGAHLALLDSNRLALDALAQELHHMAVPVQVAEASLHSAQGVCTEMHAVLAPYGYQLDILIANVGVPVAGTFTKASDRQLNEVLRPHLLSSAWACQTAVPLMRGRPGANIVLMGSGQGNQSDDSPYFSPQIKAALHSLAGLLARKYGPAIRVNAVVPGMPHTPQGEGLIKPPGAESRTEKITTGQREHQRRGIPFARLGEPPEIADAVLFLAQNAFCTGTILDIRVSNVRGV